MYYAIMFYDAVDGRLLFEVEAPVPPQVGDSVTNHYFNEKSRKWVSIAGTVAKVEHNYRNRTFNNLKVYITVG